MGKFRRLKASEVDARVATVTAKGCSLLLFKDARVDMNILDETVGMMNWKREHQLIGDRLYCTVSIWDSEKNQWISKQDVGVESYTEKEKGQASDSFKRACFNIGIGRELYTAPFIWIGSENVTLMEKDGKYTTRDRFSVNSIEYDDEGNISALAITNESRGDVVYEFPKQSRKKAKKAEPKPEPLKDEKITDIQVKALKSRYPKPEQEKNIFEHFGIKSWEEMTIEQMNVLVNK